MLFKIPASLALCVFSPLASALSSTCAVGGDSSIVANDGTPVGTEEIIDGSECEAASGVVGIGMGPERRTLTRLAVNMYISRPNASAPVTNTAVIYLTDVYGINLTQNRL